MPDLDNSFHQTVNDLAEALDSLLLMIIVLVVIVILVVGVEFCVLINWVVKGRCRSKEKIKNVLLLKKPDSAVVRKLQKGASFSSKSSKSSVSEQSRGRTPFQTPSSNHDQKPVPCYILPQKQSVNPIAVRDKSTSPCHPTTRAAESHDERSMKVQKEKASLSSSAYPPKETVNDSGRTSSQVVVVPKDVKVELEQLDSSSKTQNPLVKEDHKDHMRGVLHLRKLFLGELPNVSPKSLEKLKPVVKVAEVRIDMPVETQGQTVKKQDNSKDADLQTQVPLIFKQDSGVQKDMSVKPANNRVVNVDGFETPKSFNGSKVPEKSVLPRIEPQNGSGKINFSNSSTSKFPEGSPV